MRPARARANCAFAAKLVIKLDNVTHQLLDQCLRIAPSWRQVSSAMAFATATITSSASLGIDLV